MTASLTPSSTHWQPLPPPSPESLNLLLAQPALHPVVARIAARRIASEEEVKRWFKAYGGDLGEPFALHDLAAAIDRLLLAISSHDEVLVFGDYDTDGITGTALMVQGLTRCGAKVTHFIPDRETEGYGLTPAAMTRALEMHPQTKLLVTVDCGITSVAEVATLAERAIDVIITDHHLPVGQLPSALAIVNPRLGAPEGAECLCGCAVAFTVIHALYERLGLGGYKNFLDLVAVATIADVMPLTGENRALVQKGLYILNHLTAGNPGLTALVKAQGGGSTAFTAEDVAFRLVPCINAASRVGDWALAYNLVTSALPTSSSATTGTPVSCEVAAKALVEANEKRRKIEAALRAKIDAMGLKPAGNLMIAFGSQEEGFHPGVLGIVAARLAEQHHLPAVVCCVKPDGSASGSMRSMGAWHAVQALETIADLCEHFGGHAAAAGFALKPNTFEAFRARLPEAFCATESAPEVVTYDEDLETPIDEHLYHSLTLLEPYGTGNPRPRFVKQLMLSNKRTIGKEGSHVQLEFYDTTTPDVPPLRAIWFGAAKRTQTWELGTRVRLLFTLNRDRLSPDRPTLNIIDAFPIP